MYFDQEYNFVKLWKNYTVGNKHNCKISIKWNKKDLLSVFNNIKLYSSSTTLNKILFWQFFRFMFQIHLVSYHYALINMFCTQTVCYCMYLVLMMTEVTQEEILSCGFQNLKISWWCETFLKGIAKICFKRRETILLKIFGPLPSNLNAY